MKRISTLHRLCGGVDFWTSCHTLCLIRRRRASHGWESNFTASTQVKVTRREDAVRRICVAPHQILAAFTHVARVSMFYSRVWRRETNRGCENETVTKCARVCIAVNLAGELSYAPKAAPAIWPPRLHVSPPLPPHLLLTLSFSPLRTATHMLGVRDCVRVWVWVDFCVWEVFWQPLVVEYNNKNCPVGIRSHIPVRPSSFALSPLLLFLRTLVFSFAIPFFCAIFSQHRWNSPSHQLLRSFYSTLSLSKYFFFFSLACLILCKTFSLFLRGIVHRNAHAF